MTSLVALFRAAPWLAILILLGVTIYQSDKIHDWHRQSDRCAAAREADRQSYETAQAQAAQQNKADVAKREARSKQISEETKSAYQNDLAKLRADSDRRVREARAAAAQGSADKPGASKDGAPAEGTDADGLRLSPDERLQAGEIELRLMHLQNYIREQLGAQ